MPGPPTAGAVTDVVRKTRIRREVEPRLCDSSKEEKETEILGSNSNPATTISSSTSVKRDKLPTPM